MKKTYFKKSVSLIMTVLMLMSCWVFFPGEHNHASAADAVKDKYLFAYFTDNSSDGQTVHLAVSEDGLHYTALRNNEPVIIPSKGTGAIRDPYLWYNEQDNYYYLICTDMDASGNVWWDNCNGFLMWRSKDLVHWYDETFINVYDMLQKFNQPVEIVHRAWAPQIMWDGSSYVVYFSIDTDNVSYPADQLSIVYFKTSDLMNLDAYYEYGGLYYPGSDVNDAEIIQHPTTGKWYLFYKPEGDGSKIYMLQSDNATGPYTSPVADAKGLDIFSGVNEALEGGNGYFDNEGNFVMYADAYGHGSSYFYLTKTSATGDFMSWELIDNSTHNINSLSPRHGSVVKISTEEYNRLLNNAYGITSSSFSADEELSDHLIARYFTTADPTYNAANGKNDLTIYGTLGQGTDALATIGYYYLFDGSTNYAEIDLETLDGGDFKDGFTITFTALATSGSNSRFYEIADNFGQQTDGVSHYTHFAVAGDNGGAYIGNYNGPSGVNHKWTAASKNYNDDQVHEYIVSYADGNTIVYCDGELIIKMNRFDNAGTDDDAWYDAIRNETMLIGKSGWSADPLFAGAIADFCIYDCSMSYYDVKNIQNEQDIKAGLVSGTVSGYNGFTNTAPSFKNDESAIGTSYYSNILYSPKVEGTLPYEEGEDKANPDSGSNSKQAAVAAQSQYTNVGIYYSKNTVMYVDGITTPKMPVMLAARLNKNNYDSQMIKAYPSASSSSTADSSNFYLTQNWYGWTRYPNFTYAITNPDGSSQRIGHNSSTSLSADLDDGGSQSARSVYYYASVLALNEANVTFNSYGYQKFDPSWYWEASTSGSSSSSGNASSNETSSQHGTNHAIWVVDLRSYVAAKNEIAANYNSIVTNTSYCPATVDAYKSVVEALMAFNASSYDYAGGVEAAVKACSTDAQKLVNEYNTAKANLGTCKTLTIEGREATCAYPGLTEGSYCEYCGEVFAEQTTTEKLAHTFGTQFTENGVDYYVQCSVCGIKLLVKQNEVRYENLFSLNSFFSTRSFNGGTVHNATASIDFEKSLLSIVNTASSEGYTYGSHTNKNYANYSMPVEPSTTYVAEYYSTTAESIDVFVFYYDKDQNYINLASKGVSAIGTHTLEFTTPANCEYIEFRFDSNTAGKKVAVADFGLYTKDSYNTFAKENPYSRLGFNTGESIELYTPKRIGYEFLGWYTSSGTKVTNTAQLENSVTVYAKWREVGNSVLYNGNLFSLTEYAKTNDYVMQNSVIDGHLWVDFANATFNTLSAREGLGKASLTEAQQLDTYNNYGSYRIPVTAGQEYVYTSTHANRSSYQTYLFFYGASGGVTHPATGSSHISHSTNNAANGAVSQWIGNTLVIRFTVPEGATHMSIRMGTTGKYAFTQTFSDIGLYTAADYDEFVSGGFLPTQTYVPDGENVALATPERTGYTFAGWYENKDCTGNALTDTSAMTADKTVYAKWTPVEYTLTYALDGGSMSDATTKTYTIKDSFTLPTPTKTGYTFNGWKVTTADGNWAEDGVCNAGDTVANMSGNVTLTAQWTINSFTVTFVDANGDTVEEKTYNYGEVPTAPANTAGYNDEEGHHTFAWPTISAVTGNVTYKETKKIGEHTVVTDAAVEATCTTPGKTEGSHCSVCNVVLVAQTEVPATGHSWSDATCTAPKTCSVCDATEGEALGHNYTSEVTTPATCTQPGVKTYTCSTCGDSYTEEIEATGHSYTSKVTAPTCTEQGYTTYTCACGDTYKDNYVDALNHDYTVFVETVGFTCTNDGYDVYKCSRCTETTHKNPTNAAHTLTQVDAKEPTCGAPGWDAYEYCTKCDYTTKVEKPATGAHIYTYVQNADKKTHTGTCTCGATVSGDCAGGTADCTNAAVCVTCNKAYGEALGHDWGAWTTATAATCTADGEERRDCSRCDEYETNTLTKLGHTFVNDVAAKPANCEDAGNKAYKSCSTCDKYFAEVEGQYSENGKADTTSFVINALGHTYGEWIEEDPATCIATGTKGHYECSVCHKYFDAGKNEIADLTINVDADAHTNLVKTDAKPATCTDDGNIDYWTCDGCKKIYSDAAATSEITVVATVITASGHTEGEAVKESIVKATCTADGSYNEVVYCTVCDAQLSSETKTISAREHDYGEWYYASEENKPTYTAEGTQTRDCKNTTATELYEACSHSETQSVPMLVDDTAPTGTISIDTSTWDKFLETITFGIYTSKNVALTITATDDESGVDKIYYYISASAMTEDEVKAITTWEEYTGSVSIDKTDAETIVVYAKLVNTQNGVSYLSTDGVTFDKTAPVITTNINCTSATVTVEDANLDKVTVDGAEVEITDGAYTLNIVGTYEVVATDKAGNSTTETVEIKGHTPGAEANCTTAQTCTVCQEVLVEALGHNYTSEVTAPTCTEKGYTTYTCTRCDDSYVDNYVDAKGHTEGEVKIEKTVNATCTVDGSHEEAVYCTVCSAELSRKTVTDKAPGHTPGATANCTTAQTCTVCQEVLVEALGHTPAEAVVENEVDSTCYAEGSYDEVVYCSVCKAAGKTEVLSTETKTIAKKAHTPAEAVVENEVDSTCYAEGSYDEVVYCSVAECKAKLSSTPMTIEKKAHTPAEAVRENEVDSTCYAEGSYDEVVYCSVAECKEKLSSTPMTIEKKEHTPAEAIRENEVDSTCYAEGSYDSVVYCSVAECKEKLSSTPMTIEKKAHTPEAAVIENNVEPDCENDGSYDSVIYCSVCKAAGEPAELSRNKVTVEKTGHNYTSEVTKEPTCTEKGERTYTCQNDTTHTYTEDIAPLGHIDDNGDGRCDRCTTLICDHKDQGTHVTDKVDATCENDGYTGDIRCDKCNEIVQIGSTVNKLGHAFTEKVETVDPTCTADGYTTYKCSRCDATEDRDTVPAAHKLTKTEAKAETCDLPGNIEYWTCSACDKLYKDEAATQETKAADVVIPAKGHNYTAINTVAPTCTEKGYTSYKCDYCTSAYDSDFVDALGHSYDLTTGTNNNDGTHTVTCTRCAEGTDGHTAVVDCSYGEGVVTAPTCTKGGYTTHTCTVCGYSYTDATTQANGHSYGDADCNNPATCTVCGATTGEALGHNYKSEVTAPTCTEKGYTTYTCTRCDDSYVDNYVDAKGHDMQETAAEVKATCTSTGTTAVLACANGCGKTEGGEVIPEDATNHASEDTYTLNEKEATCYEEGYTGDIYYSCCNVLKTKGSAIEKIAHTPAEAVRENEVDSTCYAEGSYDEVVYCSVEECKAKLSSTPKTIEKKEHTPAEAVVENEVDSTCYKEGSYDEVVYCSVAECKEKLSSTPKTIEKKEHTPAEAVRENEVDSTCYAEGSYDEVVYCSVEACKHEISRTPMTIEKIAHTEGTAVEENRTESTCKVAGSYDSVVYCSVCDEKLSSETIALPLAAHTEGTAVIENKVDPGCENEGSYDTVVYCTVCNDVLSKETTTVDALGHKWVAADCESPRTCSVCGATDGEALGHTWVAATCTTPKTCSVCGNTEGTVGGHTVVTLPSKAPTCEEGGFSEGSYCSVCNEVFSAQIAFPATGHIEATRKENIVPSTCNKEGSYDLVTYCVTCDKVLSTEVKVIEKLDHTPMAETIVKEVLPTCKDAGYRIGVTNCSVCGEEIERRTIVLPALKHSPVESKYVAPTCEETGLTEGVYCEVCGTVITAQEVIPAKGHKKETITATIEAATCTKEGVREITVFCTVCNKTLSVERQVIPVAEHTPADEIRENVTEATCGKNGKYTSIINCSVCGAEISNRVVVIPSTGEHEFTVEKNRVEPTCSENGYITYACEDCGTQEKTILYAPGHTDKNGDSVCDDCGYSFNNHCGCMCHKDNWFIRFIYKIVNFFWKIFKIHKECQCGSIHY